MVFAISEDVCERIEEKESKGVETIRSSSYSQHFILCPLPYMAVLDDNQTMKVSGLYLTYNGGPCEHQQLLALGPTYTSSIIL